MRTLARGHDPGGNAFETAVDVPGQLSSGLVQLHAIGVSGEERNPEPRFELLDLPTDRAGGDAQVTGGALEALGTRRLGKRPQRIQREALDLHRVIFSKPGSSD